jgi:hypothetical protein
MRRLIYTIISFLCATSFIQNSANACTIVKVTQGGTTFVGNNEDGTDPTTYLWFLPASKGKFGRIYFTLSDK